MIHRSTAFALLLLSGLILLAGPYPCQAQAPAPEAPAAAAPCHEADAASGRALDGRGAAPGDDDCCAEGHDALCEHACQAAAVLAFAPQESDVEPVTAARALEVQHLLPPLPHGLDHIPLA